MGRKVLSEEEMKDLLGEETEAKAKERSTNELLDEKKTDDRPIDEVPAGVHLLKKPIRFDEQEIMEITYDMDCLTPVQYINLVKRLSKKKQISVPEVDMDVQIAYFALASGIPVSVLKSELATDDFTQICGLVRTFLLGASTEDLE